MARAPRKLAAFDIDGTLFRSSLLVELVEKMVAQGLFPERAADGFSREHTLWRTRKGGYEAYLNALVHVFEEHLKGVHYGDFADVAHEVVDERKDFVYRYTRDLLKELKKKEYFIVAISNSPKTALDVFGAHFGFDKVYGRMYELGPENRFTGVTTDEHLIANKGTIVQRVVEKEGVTLAGSVGVGDTESDIPLLEKVERAVCFNPNARLYRYARQMGWEVIVERKDVVYEL